uniref:Cytochrome P450 4C1 n=1 Tax=Cacopsylla melanoneura TaxID=428564 RepID=A0A8D8TA67_9HEMI
MFILGTLILVFLLSSLLLLLAVHFWHFRRFYYLGYQIPGMSLGIHYLYIVMSWISMENLTKLLLKVYADGSSRSNGSMFKIWYGSKLLVILTNPELIRKIFQRNLRKDDQLYSLMDHGLQGKALLTENCVPKWKNHRKIITRASLNFDALKSYIKIFHEESNILADKMESMANTKHAFRPEPMLTLAGFSMVLRTLYGVDMRMQQTFDEEHPFLLATEFANKILMDRIRKPWFLLDATWKLTGNRRREVKGRQIIRTFVDNIVGRVRENMKKQFTEFIPDISKDTSKSAQNYVEVVLQDQLNPDIPKETVMTDDDLFSEILVMIIGGTDTSKITNTVMMIMLALHSNVQEEVYEEILTVLGNDPDTIPTYSQLQELHTLTRVIKETLRLVPSVHLIAREADEELEIGGYTIPKGVGMYAIISGMHRDPHYWSNPNQFNPDRFLPSASKESTTAYFPFGEGPHLCPGNKYAMLQMKTMMSTLLRRYRILPGDECRSVGDVRFEFGMTMSLVADGNDIRLEPRV